MPNRLIPVHHAPWANALSFSLSAAMWSEDEGAVVIDVGKAGTEQIVLRDTPVKSVWLKFQGSSYDATHETTPPEFGVVLPGSAQNLIISIPVDRQVGVTVHVPHDDLRIDVSGHGDRRRSKVDLHGSRLWMLRASNVKVVLQRPEKTTHKMGPVYLDNAHLVLNGRAVQGYSVTGKCAFDLSNCRPSTLTVRGTSVLKVRMTNSRFSTVEMGRLEGSSSSQSETRLLVVDDGSNFEVTDGSGVNAVVRPEATMTIHSGASDIVLRGPGVAAFHGSGERIGFVDDAPLVHVRNNAQLVDVHGRIRLGEVAGAGIIGRSRRRHDPIDGDRLILEALSADGEHSKGLTVNEVVIPQTLRGLQMIATLQSNAQQVSPAIHDKLPGLGALAGPRLSALLRPNLSDSEMQIAGQYARSLADLANSTGAPASVRTQLAWCSYRMRTATAPARAERVLLGFYRLVGYGERVVPAALTYITIAALMNILALHDADFMLSVGGMLHWLRGFLDWLVTPLHILKLTGDRQTAFTFSQPWDTLARLLVAIPFATGVLALRKYVKEDRK